MWCNGLTTRCDSSGVRQRGGQVTLFLAKNVCTAASFGKLSYLVAFLSSLHSSHVTLSTSTLHRMRVVTMVPSVKSGIDHPEGVFGEI